MNKTKTVYTGGLIALAALLLVPQVSHCGSNLNTVYGSDDIFLSAEIAATAGTGVAVNRGGYGTIFNPATITAGEKARFDSSASLAQDHENRFAPLFDSFGSFVTDTAIASNRNHYWNGSAALATKISDKIAFGASIANRYDWSYDFAEDMRNSDSSGSPEFPRDSILERRAYSVGGALRDLSAGLSYELTPDLSVGAALHYLFGTQTGVMSSRFFQVPANSYSYESDNDVEGISASYGFLYSANERLSIGASYEPAYDIDGEQVNYTTESIEVLSSESTVNYPGRYRAGFAFFPQTDPRTTFTAEFIFTPWSELEDSRVEGDQRLEDTFDVRVGVEHMFYNGSPLRFGFRHTDVATDNEVSRSSFTMGTGLEFGPGSFSFSVELSKMTSSQDHVFGYEAYDDFYAPGNTRVEDTRFRLGAGYTYLF